MENLSLRVQDVFRIIVPGTILLVFIFFVVDDKYVESKIITYKDLESILFLIFLSSCVLLGYLIDMISSILEKGLYWLINKPSYHIINETKLVVFFHSEYQSKEFFKQESNNAFNFENLLSYDDTEFLDTDQTSKLFNHCNRLKENIVNEKAYEKLNTYLYAKVLSRNLTVLFLIIFTLLAVVNFKVIYLFLLVLILVSLYRWLKLSFNYTRQVFVVCEQYNRIK